ncbi:flocculation protein FLO11-like [Megalobrama amblycephala]|uniref:flocculation protein FLO11-like n=1 Tax=Megalobrama amblycephala TaxID=75352 RepID=UPI0020142276|nr:flocculation protein FLO11-like [Megalobrama amblycephala]XP_048042882.1 flocculation protein FLO11-like [Megalobrama amblycephala]
MAPRYVCALIIFTGVIIVTGLLASWMMGFERTEIKKKSSINPFKISTDAAQTETTTLADALAVTEGVSNTPKAQVITDFLGTAPVKKMSGTSRASSAVALAELSRQTTAETAAVSAAGSVETTAGRTVTLSETIEKVTPSVLPVTKKAETLETAKSTLGESVTAHTQIKESTYVESSTNTAQNTPKPESLSVSDIKQTHKSETEPTEVGITVPKQESGTTSFAHTTTAANIMSASPIPEPKTDGATHFITSQLKPSEITSENKATTESRPAATFITAAFITETKVDLTEGKPAPSTFIKMLKTAGTEQSKAETSETTTVRPQESTQAIKTSNGPTKINRATGIKFITAIGTKGKTVGKRLSTAGRGITKKGRHGQEKTPLSHDKTLYSAITMGCILVICALLALIVFIKDFIGC